MQSNFFRWCLLHLLNSSLLISGSPLCFCSTAQPWFWLRKKGYISTCPFPHIISHGCRVASLSHMSTSKASTLVTSKGQVHVKSSGPQLVSLCQTQDAVVSPEPTEQEEVYKPPHKAMAKMKRNAAICGKKRCQIKADGKTRQLYLSIVTSTADKQIP